MLVGLWFLSILQFLDIFGTKNSNILTTTMQTRNYFCAVKIWNVTIFWWFSNSVHQWLIYYILRTTAKNALRLLEKFHHTCKTYFFFVNCGFSAQGPDNLLLIFYSLHVLHKYYFAHMRDFESHPRCLKITEKVSFNIASEASYVYNLSGQKLIKNAKNGPIWRVFEDLKLAVKQCYQTSQF